METIGVMLMICGLVSIDAAPQNIPPLISFEDGKIGVNFLGFHAKAGLSGLGSDGPLGLHAEAGTPFGQRAAAGLRGTVAGQERAAGELYAGATAGGNVKAAAGLGGAVVGGDNPHAGGTLYSGAGVPGIGSGASLDGISSAHGQTIQKTYVGRPSRVSTKRVVKVVPSYDDSANEVFKNSGEGEVREVKVTKVKSKPVNAHKRVDVRYETDEEEEEEPVQSPKRINEHAQRVNAQPFAGFGNSFLNSFLSPSYNHQTYKTPTYSHSSEEVPEHRRNIEIEKRVTYGNQAAASGSNFFADIFNIPISTLGAVSKFLSNSANAAGNLHVAKSVNVHK